MKCEAASPNRWHVDKYQNDFFAYLKTLMTSFKVQKNYGAAAKIGKVMKDCVQKVKMEKTAVKVLHFLFTYTYKHENN